MSKRDVEYHVENDDEDIMKDFVKRNIRREVLFCSWKEDVDQGNEACEYGRGADKSVDREIAL